MAKSLNVLIGATLDSNVTKNLNAELENLNLNKIEIQLGFDKESVDGIKTAIKQSLTSAFNGISFVENEAKDIGQAIGENIAKGLQGSKKQITRHLNDVVKETDKAAEKVTKKLTRAFAIGDNNEKIKTSESTEIDYGDGFREVSTTRYRHKKDGSLDIKESFLEIDNREKIAAREAEKASKIEEAALERKATAFEKAEEKRRKTLKETLEAAHEVEKKLRGIYDSSIGYDNSVYGYKQDVQLQSFEAELDDIYKILRKDNVQLYELIDAANRLDNLKIDSDEFKLSLDKNQDVFWKSGADKYKAQQALLSDIVKAQQTLSEINSKVSNGTSKAWKTGDLDKYIIALNQLEEKARKGELSLEECSYAAKKLAEYDNILNLKLKVDSSASSKIDSYLEKLDIKAIKLKSQFGDLFDEQEFRNIGDKYIVDINSELKKVTPNAERINKIISNWKHEVSKFEVKLSASAKEIKRARRETEILNSSLGRFVQFYGFGELFRTVKTGISEMVNAVTEIDDAVVELKKVTQETEHVYDRFLGNSAEKAQKLGVTITDYINSVTNFARMGYSFEDSQIVAETANIMQTVSESLTADESAEYLISIMKAFGIEAKNSLSIVDKLNNVSNNFAITTDG